ncbi:MAG: Gfo/Idh/MocA family oxidoreductase [Planctomycetes bacterium]|nr:Gfo/Idh/MocA family oxidoreductase [Planctomycetota bacterium]
MRPADSATRRTFLQTAAVAGAGAISAPYLALAKPQDSKEQPAAAPQEKKYSELRVAYVGTGGIGGHHLEETTKLGVSCLCYCDVDTRHFKRAAEAFPKAKGYQDYREMMDKESKNFDAVLVGVPDHSHYPATMIAMQLGKHVYTQKPLTHTIWEARQLTEMAKKNPKLVTQMGNQGHAKEGWRLAYEWVHSGALGDMACHTMDGIFWALDPGYPTAVQPLAYTPVTSEMFPKSSMIMWEFPAKGNRPAFKSYWYDGGLVPTVPRDLEAGRKLAETGNLWIGTKASLLISGDYGESPRVFPESRMKEIGKPKQLLERSPGHFKEWVQACVGEKPVDFPKTNFGYSGPMTETIQLGNVALRMGRRLEWDGAKLQFTNCPEANQFVSKEYRQGWKF